MRNTVSGRLPEIIHVKLSHYDFDDMLVQGKIIRGNIYPYPALEEMTSFKGEKYVRSMPNESKHDNLLNLPRV